MVAHVENGTKTYLNVWERDDVRALRPLGRCRRLGVGRGRSRGSARRRRRSAASACARSPGRTSMRARRGETTGMGSVLQRLTLDRIFPFALPPIEVPLHRRTSLSTEPRMAGASSEGGAVEHHPGDSSGPARVSDGEENWMPSSACLRGIIPCTWRSRLRLNWPRRIIAALWTLRTPS